MVQLNFHQRHDTKEALHNTILALQFPLRHGIVIACTMLICHENANLVIATTFLEWNILKLIEIKTLFL